MAVLAGLATKVCTMYAEVSCIEIMCTLFSNAQYYCSFMVGFVLRTWIPTGAAVTCIQFSPDGSKILTGGHDSTCREFGLLTSRMLKEFRGHKSYVNCCNYVILSHSVAMGAGGSGSDAFLAVVTASADGSVRLWNGRTAEPVREITPPIPTSANATIHDKDSIVISKSIHAVAHLHSPTNTMIVVLRADRAYAMSYWDAVLQNVCEGCCTGGRIPCCLRESEQSMALCCRERWQLRRVRCQHRQCGEDCVIICGGVQQGKRRQGVRD